MIVGLRMPKRNGAIFHRSLPSPSHLITNLGSGDIEALVQMAVCTRASDDYMGYWEQPSHVIILEVGIEAAAATYLVDKFYSLLMVEWLTL
jgi:hypothetical protein